MEGKVVPMHRPVAAINGFGRFGLGLFRAWFFDPDSPYDIAYINDQAMDMEKVVSILTSDPIVKDFHDLSVSSSGDNLLIARTDGSHVRIGVTRGPIETAAWLGVPEYLFECSGITRRHGDCRDLLILNTRTIIIGSVIDNPDAILVMGTNHHEYERMTDKVISFGSCTVIPGVTILAWFERLFGVRYSTVNVVHSVAKWQLDLGRWKTIERKVCTLEAVLPKVVHTIEPKQIKVNYTYAPYYGPSLMDFEIVIRREVMAQEIIDQLSRETTEGSLKNIVSLTESDKAYDHVNSPFSIDIVTPSLDIRGDRIYFFGYFNNEGSGIRLHELAKYVIAENSRP